MLEKARDAFSPGSLGQSRSFYALGDIYKYVLYDFDKAEVNYEQALSIQQRVDPSDIKNLTRLYYNLATANRSQHDYETAISWCLKAVGGCIAMKDDEFLERAYSIVGNIYRDSHEFDSAVVYYKKGVEVNKKLNKGKDNVTLAGLYGGWGETNYLQGDLDEARNKLGYAVSIYRKAKNVDKSIYFHTVRLLGQIEIDNGDPESALPFLNSASAIRKEMNLEKGGPASALYKNFGDYNFAMEKRSIALEYFQKALQATTTEQLGDDGNPKNIDEVEFKDFAYDALLAKAALLTGQDALDCYSIAEKLMIASRSELDTEDAKWNYIDANYRLYESIFNVISQLENTDESQLFHYMESSKSKSLSDALQEAELRKGLGRSDTLIARLRDLRQRSLSLQHQIDEKNESAIRDQLITNSQQISVIEAGINTKYPSYIKTRYENASVPIDALKEKVTALDAVFAEYFWGDHNVYVLVVSPDTVNFYKLDGLAPNYEDEISRYVALFSARANQYSRLAVREFSGLSRLLYHDFVEPFQQQLTGRKRLIIVPDGPLMQIPFETLVTKEGDSYNNLPYLLNDHVVSYAFSASHLLANRTLPKANPSLLAFGFTGGAAERSPNELKPEIAGSETELIALSNKFPDGTFLYGAGVTEKNFKEKAAGYDLLHLAVHGRGDAGEDYSATLYFRDQEGPEDGRLYWYELYNMNLRASLAVLSSCESGIGKTYRGEGMLSMANAFTFAGCGNIVMGLWKVDDQVSVKLMDTFYSELLDGMAIDEALAIAKRTYLASADQISANPKLWGSLVAYGEAPILRADEIPTSWVVMAITLLVVAIILLVIKTRKK